MKPTDMEKYSQLKEKRINLREAIPLAKPFAVLFEPTSLCNFRCRCCFHNDPAFRKAVPRGRMEFDDFRKIVDDLADWPGDRLKVIRIIGFGEPLLNPETPRMIAHLKKINIADRVEMTTNASLLTPDVSTDLIDVGLDYIRCSIYAIRQSRHETLTQNNIRVETMKNNIATLKKKRDAQGLSRPFIYVKMLTSEDKTENEAFLKLYAPVADEVAIETPHAWLSSTVAGTGKMRQVCPQPFKMLSIHFNGDVILCDPDWKGNTWVGNAVSEKVSNIWGGANMRRFWRMQLENRRYENESCRHCTFLVDEYAIDDLDGIDSGRLERGRNDDIH